MDKFIKVMTWVGIGLASIAFVMLLVLIPAVIFSLLWNWLAPTLFNWPEVTILQAWGIIFLISCLKGSLFTFKAKT